MELTDAQIVTIEHAAESAAPVFAANGWTWAGIGIPTVDDIRENILRLLENVYDFYREQPDSNVWAVSSGRLVVGLDTTEDGASEDLDFYINLEIGDSALEMWDLFGDNEFPEDEEV